MQNVLDKKPFLAYTFGMTEKRLRNILKDIESGHETPNEILFAALRFCERKLEVCDSRTYRKLWQKRVNRIKNVIVTQNEGLVFACIQRVGGRSDDEEMIREAYFALTRSIRCYDITRGFKWSTYVMNGMIRALWRYKRTKPKDFQLDEGNLPEYIQEFDIPSGDVEVLREVLVDNAADLSLKEIEILDLLFFKGQNLKEVGSRFNLCRERIRQLKEMALDKIRKVLEKQPQEVTA